MKIVNLLGGLGNQMFEYAMYLALKEAHPLEDIRCSTRSFRGYGLHNGFELNRIFGIKVKEASLWQLARLAYPFWNYRSWQIINHCLPKRSSMICSMPFTPYTPMDVERKDSIFYDGYWQNEDYFKPVRQRVLEVFRFPEFQNPFNRQLADKIASVNSVSCHVRRGDYLKNMNMCMCMPEYYERAINKIQELTAPELFCIFSDDIEWCKQQIGPLCQGVEVVYVDWNKGENSYRDMQLMSLCKHNIIANSSFSWWGAWLNQNPKQIVISPNRWMSEEIVNEPICKSWIRIHNTQMK